MGGWKNCDAVGNNLTNLSVTLKLSDLTYKVVSFSDVVNFDTDQCVDWATEMIFLGYDTPSLCILAGLNKPTNYFEIVEFLPEVLSSLKLTQKKGDEATLSYCSYYIKKISASENIRQNLSHVYQYCQLRDYEGLIYDFYLLYWAWSDIDYGNEYTPYWETATKYNIEKIVIETANNWMADNKQHYIQHYH